MEVDTGSSEQGEREVRVQPHRRRGPSEELLLRHHMALPGGHRDGRPQDLKPGIPLAPYADDAAFKLFLVDIGPLVAMAQLEKETVVGGNGIFEEFRGSLTEQYVCQQLVSDCGLVPYYWSTENPSGEIDFLAQRRNSVFAVEGEAEENLRSKSLRTLKGSHPDVEAVRFSLSECREQDWMRNVPLCAMANMEPWA